MPLSYIDADFCSAIVNFLLCFQICKSTSSLLRLLFALGQDEILNVLFNLFDIHATNILISQPEI